KHIEDVHPFEPELSLAVDAYIPDMYILDEKQKIEMYKQFSAIYDRNDLAELQDNLIDRSGDHPEQESHLYTVTYFKMIAKRERIASIHEKNKKIELLVDENRSQQIDGAKLFELANEFGRDVQLGTENNQLKIIFRPSREWNHKRYERVCHFIDKMTSVDREAG